MTNESIARLADVLVTGLVNVGLVTAATAAFHYGLGIKAELALIGSVFILFLSRK